MLRRLLSALRPPGRNVPAPSVRPDLPFERIETTGALALATWEALRAQNRGWPIVVGDDTHLAALATSEDGRSVDEILAAAQDRTRFEAMVAERVKDNRDFLEALADGDPELLERTGDELAPLGEWPDAHPPPIGLTAARDRDMRPLERVHILVLPTWDCAEAPAHLRFGGWSGCPPAEHHVATLRAWRARYGIEIVGMRRNAMNLRVARRAADRDEALALAREHYAYCMEIVYEGLGELRPFAAGLMANDWWYFYWE